MGDDRPDAAETASGDLVNLARQWAAAEPDEANRAELERLARTGDTAGLGELFGGGLRFGTSGLRAPLGPGPRRMNRLVARQVASGLVSFLATTGPEAPVVVVGCDARRGSKDMAADIAAVVVAAGGRALAFDGPVPTPLLAFAIAELGADAAVMVTASHNPPSDNGVKIYTADGGQPVPPRDTVLAEAIERASFDTPRAADPAAAGAGVEPVPQAITDAYLSHVASLVESPARPAGPLVHTALHGVGWPLLSRAFETAGMEPPVPTASQRDPDPAFPTVAYPNPEESGALDAAIETARQLGAVAVLANDPDADRLALAVPARSEGPDGRWQVLSGNELGWLLADHRLAATAGMPDRLVVTTFETSRLVSRLAAEAGAVHLDVPTGFKWIARAAAQLPGANFVFGYEEAIGYAVSDRPRDKDGIAAALVAAELLAECAAEGETVWDRLDRIADHVGHHATATHWRRLDAPQQLEAAMDQLRSSPPERLAASPVTGSQDLRDGQLGHPVEAMVLHLEGGARLVVRPSGTEPKLKVYAEVVTAGPDAGGQRMAADMAGELLDHVLGGD